MEKVTSVKIDNDKWEILKGRGYKLQDIINNAFNNLLDIEYKEDIELIKEIDRLKNKNKVHEREKENLKKTLKNKTKKLESRIEELENEIKELEKIFDEDNNNLEIKINENKFKIKELKEVIKEDNIKKENGGDDYRKDYITLIDHLILYKGDFTLVKAEIKDFADKWNIKKEVDINKIIYKEYINKSINNNQDLIHNINNFREDN